ncbi:CapA family protein [Streptomyces sp. A7024]|uniref:CapA family protein n=1 Tax=Streptomyces coryli TaxID=1128680 RepID=A0A6G4UDR1_9ACTN|nr:CapA family protein [Streptomyces coryli]NGN70359.1 CapA family protein [Streptomyces coryli]
MAGASRPRRRVVLAAAAAGVAAGCTGGGERPRPRRASSHSADPDRPATSAPAARLPQVLAVHPTRTGLAVSRRLAEAVIAGRVHRWRELGGGAGTLRVVRGRDAVAAVRRDPDALAVIRADALGPGVAAVPVAGADPVTEPARYPLTAAAPRGSAPGPVIRTLWTGDIMLGRRVGAAMADARDWQLPFSRTAERLAAADLTVGNLECTLSRAGPPTQGGDSFAADPRAAAGLRRAGFDVLTLANNHLGDFGTEALRRTVRTLRRAGFTTTGAGDGLAEARRPAIAEVRGVRFGILAFNAIGETPAAGDGRPGAYSLRMPPRTGPLDRPGLDRLAAEVAALRDEADVVVVCPHWGEQYTHRPVPAQRTVGRRLAEAGADAVVGAHPHWVQGMELHRGRLIAHSLGNFVFDMDFAPQTRQGVVLELVFWGARLMSVRPMPVVIGDGHVPRFAAGDAAAGILEQVWSTGSGPFSRRG